MNKKRWFIFIGLEVHAQIISKSKLFSAAKNLMDDKNCSPNTCLDWLDYALPGTLPVLNEYCVQQAIKTALGINADLNMTSYFDRKNYFYPDLPLGYQITQHYKPLAENGYLDINISDDKNLHRIKINSLHLEQDAGKLLHNYQESGNSAVDFNRAGVPLMEIVTAPEMKSADEAVYFVKMLRTILRYLGTCSGDMQNGSLRVDANVSISTDPNVLGTRTEIKNLNSLKFIKQAINYEIERHMEILSINPQELKSQTRLFNESTGRTHAMRNKENKYEYRYFNDPDLPPLCLDQECVDSIQRALPELPQEKYLRLCRQYNLNKSSAETLIQEQKLADFYECSIAEIPHEPQLVANWLLSQVLGILHKNNLSYDDIQDKACQFGILMRMLVDKTITNSGAKQVLEVLLLQGGRVDQIVEESNLSSLSSTHDIQKLIMQVIDKQPKNWQALLQGKDKLIKWFVGQIMYLTGGRADHKMVEQVITELVNKERNSNKQ